MGISRFLSIDYELCKEAGDYQYDDFRLLREGFCDRFLTEIVSRISFQ